MSPRFFFSLCLDFFFSEMHQVVGKEMPVRVAEGFFSRIMCVCVVCVCLCVCVSVCLCLCKTTVFVFGLGCWEGNAYACHLSFFFLFSCIWTVGFRFSVN